MPRGVPTAGFRKTRRYLERQGELPVRSAIKKTAEIIKFTAPAVTETTEQIAERLNDRFEILDILAQSCIVGDSRSLIVSGPPGLGKSFTIEQKMVANTIPDDCIVKGYVKATGLFKLLYQNRRSEEHTSELQSH